MKNSIFFNNTAETNGGALSLLESGNTTIQESIFYMNKANSGGAIYYDESCINIFNK